MPTRNSDQPGASRLVAHLREEGIADERVLAAIGNVPRDRFVPEEWSAQAWEDRALPLARGQTVSQPYVVAFMTEALRLSGGERVLEIGTGSGYQTAVLAACARVVYSVEILLDLARSARERLAALGVRNVEVRVGDGWDGWPEAAPFDAILVTAAAERVPAPLLAQLAPGGRMVLPLGAREQELVLIENAASGSSRRAILPVRFVPMTGRAQAPPGG